ncbi:MAG: hypothetical protein DMG76_07880 [Acidobacteria bacterium]|nr:MAG: hypothetical protein DMG76_07880 [Acidobacteriota bacterium]
MKDDDLHRILSQERQVIPSRGFVIAVMDSVRREAAAPPPIPFPWKRAWPGIGVAGLMLGALVIATITLLIQGIPNQPLWPPLFLALAPIFEVWKAVGATWIVLALVLSFASVKLSTRFVCND